MDGWQQDHYKWKHPIRVAKMRPYFEIPTAHLCHRFHPGAFIVAFVTTEDSIFYNPNMWKPREARKEGERIHHLGTDCVLNVVERVIDIPRLIMITWIWSDCLCYDSTTSLFSDSAGTSLPPSVCLPFLLTLTLVWDGAPLWPQHQLPVVSVTIFTSQRSRGQRKRIGNGCLSPACWENNSLLSWK